MIAFGAYHNYCYVRYGLGGIFLLSSLSRLTLTL